MITNSVIESVEQIDVSNCIIEIFYKLKSEQIFLLKLDSFNALWEKARRVYCEALNLMQHARNLSL